MKKFEGKKLFHIYYRSESSQCRDMDAELDGIVSLTHNQLNAVEVWGGHKEDNSDGHFVIYPAEPYKFSVVQEALES